MIIKTWYEKAASAKRSAAEIEQGVVFAQAQSRQQAELRGAHKIELARRPDVGSKMARSAGQGQCGFHAERTRVVLIPHCVVSGPIITVRINPSCSPVFCI
jgi:hypothetical protein